MAHNSGILEAVAFFLLAGVRMHDTGCKIQDAGWKMHDTGWKIQDVRCRM